MPRKLLQRAQSAPLVVQTQDQHFQMFEEPPSLSDSAVFTPHLYNGMSLYEIMEELRTIDRDNTEKITKLMNTWITLWQQDFEDVCEFADFASEQLKKGVAVGQLAIIDMSSPQMFGGNKAAFYTVREFLGQYNEVDLADPMHFLPKHVPEGATKILGLKTHEDASVDIRRRDTAYAAYWFQLRRRIEILNKKIPSKVFERINPSLVSLFRIERYFYLYTSYTENQFSLLDNLLTDFINIVPTFFHSCTSQILSSYLAFQSTLTSTINTHHLNQATYLSTLRTSLSAAKPNIDDYTCAICLTALYKPTTLHCGHSFCLRCISQCRPTQPSSPPPPPPRPSQSPSDGNNEEDSEEAKPLSPPPPQKACPLCRAHFYDSSLTRDTDLGNYLELYFPKEMRARRRERKRESIKDGFVRFVVGPPVNEQIAEHVYSGVVGGEHGGGPYDGYAFIAWPF